MLLYFKMNKWLFGIAAILLINSAPVFAQSDPSADRTFDTLRTPINNYPDSAELLVLQAQKDSLKAIGDSLALFWIKKPDPNRPNQFIDSLMNLYLVKDLDFSAWSKKFPKKINRYKEGKLRPKGEPWLLPAVLVITLFFAILKNAFSKELIAIVQSFYSNRILGQINKEDNLFTSWPFVFLYILFGLTIGMFLYLSGKYFQLDYLFQGFEWFLILSAIVVGLFTLKIVVLRLLGFFFGAQKIVKEYVSILYLSYFNSAILFLPLIIAFSLTPYKFAEIYNYLALLILVLVFAFQFIRAGTNILTSHSFPKVYLIIYLCALEFCPFLILIKALRF